jgi:pimeloyl-ACP methyl ester carboxylesterase
MYPGSLTCYTLYGELCWSGQINPCAVQLLIHGATYNRYYWDFRSYQPQNYSYVDTAISRGYTTFNIDRIGSGKSAKPDGLLNTVDSAVYTVHQVVQALRSGTFGTRFDRVVLVGHSLGSLIAIGEASLYQNVDGVILTGLTHNLNPIRITAIPNFLYPSQLDPKFGLFAPTNYLTTIPGSRDDLFYVTANTDPTIITEDERLKDVLAVGQDEILARITSPESQLIDVPVFILVGTQDLLFCGGVADCSTAEALVTYESLVFAPAACLQADVVPGTGHNLNLHLNAQESFAKMLNWMDRFMAGSVCS